MPQVVIKLNVVLYDNGRQLQLARFAYFLLKAANVLLFQGYVNYRLSTTAATLCVGVDFKLSVRKRALRFPKRKGLNLWHNVWQSFYFIALSIPSILTEVYHVPVL